MSNHKKITIILLVIILIIIIILLYLLILKFGDIEHHGPLVPTGNVDIFEINCGCVECNNTNPVFDEEADVNKNKSKKDNNGDIVVFDKYKVWDNKELRIFSNPAYEYKSIIAPGSFNSYAFVIRNNNNFDIVADISFKEENKNKINMKYKLRKKADYLIGKKSEYDFINGKQIKKVIIPAKQQISYILDWKWIDNYNDTVIGFDLNSSIKLSIDIGANAL